MFCTSVMVTQSLFTGERKAWAVLKFHILSHIVSCIVDYGWWENCSCQAGEHCHKFYIKIIRRLTNNKGGWERQVFKVHARDEGLKKIIAEIGLTHYMYTAHVICPVYA